MATALCLACVRIGNRLRALGTRSRFFGISGFLHERASRELGGNGCGAFDLSPVAQLCLQRRAARRALRRAHSFRRRFGEGMGRGSGRGEGDSADPNRALGARFSSRRVSQRDHGFCRRSGTSASRFRENHRGSLGFPRGLVGHGGQSPPCGVSPGGNAGRGFRSLTGLPGSAPRPARTNCPTTCWGGPVPGGDRHRMEQLPL